MNDFFKLQEAVPAKCAKCAIEKKKNSCRSYKTKDIVLAKKGNPDLMFILDMPEYTEQRSKFLRWLSINNVNNYVVVTAISCQTKDYSIPGDTQETYDKCNLITDSLISEINPKVVIPIGRSTYSITRSTDITTWEDFSEYLFNQTYYHSPLKHKNKKRFYPIPYLSAWLGKDNFEHFYVKRQIAEASKYAANPVPYNLEPYEIVEVKDPNAFLMERILRGVEEAAIDTETNGLDVHAPGFKCFALTLAFDSKTGYYLDFDKVDRDVLSQFLAKCRVQIYANGKFDCKVLAVSGVRNAEATHDVIKAMRMLNTVRLLLSIKSLAWLIGMGGYDEKLVKYIELNKIKDYSKIPKEIMVEYAALDPIVTYRLYKYMRGLFRMQPGVHRAYVNNVMPVQKVYEEMELEGIPVNKVYLNELHAKLELKIIEFEKDLSSKFNRKFQLSAPEQLAKALEEMGLPDYGRTKKGVYKTNEKVLLQWENDGYAIATEIIKYRGILKLQNAFVGSYTEEADSSLFFDDGDDDNSEGIAKYIHENGKIYPEYNGGGAYSGRSKCNNPNLQAFPKRDEEGKMFRPVLGREKDFYWFEADFSGFQLRIGAHYSQDPVMLDLFRNNKDMHTITAVGIFARNMKYEEFMLVKEDIPYEGFRHKSKIFNFSLLFGSHWINLVPTVKLQWTDQEVEDYITNNAPEPHYDFKGNFDKYGTIAKDVHKKFFQTYAGLPVWFKEYHELAKKQGYIDSPFGGRRHFPSLTYIGKDTDPKELKNLENIVLNSPVQNFEAMYVYDKMRKIRDEFKRLGLKSKILTMIHDSIGGFVHVSEIKQVYKILKDIMEDHTTYSIPIVIDVNFGDVLGFGTKIKNEAGLDKFIAGLAA
jgi:DNA polymerase-1